MVNKAGIVTGDTLREPSLASWFLAMKSEGNKTTFSHWPRLDTLFATQAWISLWRLPEAKASKKAVFRLRCLGSVSFIGSKGAFVSSLRTTKRFHLEDSSKFWDDPCGNWRVTYEGLSSVQYGDPLGPKCQQW